MFQQTCMKCFAAEPDVLEGLSERAGDSEDVNDSSETRLSVGKNQKK